MIEVVNVKTCKDFGKREGDVYIGRTTGKWKGSVWGNPYRLYNESQRESVIALYRGWVLQELHKNRHVDGFAHVQITETGCASHSDYQSEPVGIDGLTNDEYEYQKLVEEIEILHDKLKNQRDKVLETMFTEKPKTDDMLAILKKRYRNEMAILDYIEMIECEVMALRGDQG